MVHRGDAKIDSIQSKARPTLKMGRESVGISIHFAISTQHIDILPAMIASFEQSHPLQKSLMRMAHSLIVEMFIKNKGVRNYKTKVFK